MRSSMASRRHTRREFLGFLLAVVELTLFRTQSTTVSMALYFGELLWRHNPGHSIINTLVYLALAVITVSVVFGRLYTGMVSVDEHY